MKNLSYVFDFKCHFIIVSQTDHIYQYQFSSRFIQFSCKIANDRNKLVIRLIYLFALNVKFEVRKYPPSFPSRFE